MAEVLHRHANFTALNNAGYLYQPNLTEMKKDFVGYVFTFYDAFNPAARALYWSQINTALFSKGVDAWWLDASEPDIVEGPYTSIASQVSTFQTHMNPTAMGSGSRMLNAYSLAKSQAVYEGQRAKAANKRVFILTRKDSPGATLCAATWSGDITFDLDRHAETNPGRPGFLDVGRAVLDDGRGRFPCPRVSPKCRRRGRRGVARAEHALVRVRDVRASAARARTIAPS